MVGLVGVKRPSSGGALHIDTSGTRPGDHRVLAINGVLGFVVPGIAWQAHLGGLLAGAALAGSSP